MILNHWLFAILISTLATFHGNDSDELSKLLLKFDDGGSKTIVGEILDRNDITIEILDIRTGEKLKFAVGEIDQFGGSRRSEFQHQICRAPPVPCLENFTPSLNGDSQRKNRSDQFGNYLCQPGGEEWRPCWTKFFCFGRV